MEGVSRSPSCKGGRSRCLESFSAGGSAEEPSSRSSKHVPRESYLSAEQPHLAGTIIYSYSDPNQEEIGTDYSWYDICVDIIAS